jgi:hypothetical protein
MTYVQSGFTPTKSPGHTVFLSYRRVDDEPPPENPDGGYVRYFWGQLKWQLSQLGVPDAILWRDRGKIAPGDDWSEVIRTELNNADLFIAVLSRNYIDSVWCNEELDTMASRVLRLEDAVRQRRIFRADKHYVPDSRIPIPLKKIQAVRFYDEDKETHLENEFFWRGKVQSDKAYFGAILELAGAIYQRLEELGVPMAPVNIPPKTITTAVDSRVVYVAKPARDLIQEYNLITGDLTQSGYKVVPDKDTAFPEAGEEILEVVRSAIKQAEFSVHLLGERSGGRPDGLESDIVPLQLASAASQVSSKPGFYRLVWAPKVMPQRSSTDEIPKQRDPIEVLSRFDKMLSSDQIDGDTAARFSEFVLQRLAGKQPAPSRYVYIHCALEDRIFALKIAKGLAKLGFLPLLRPGEGGEDTPERVEAEEQLIGKARNTVICWGAVNQIKILNELSNQAFQSWYSQNAEKRTSALIIGAPSTGAKTEVVELGNIAPEVKSIFDATQDEEGLDKTLKQLSDWLRSQP